MHRDYRHYKSNFSSVEKSVSLIIGHPAILRHLRTEKEADPGLGLIADLGPAQDLRKVPGTNLLEN